MLTEKFIDQGFAFLNADTYLNEVNSFSLHDLKKVFDLELEADQGCDFRKRAYLKLQWDRGTNEVTLPINQSYFQTASSNKVDGGKIRQFKIMDKKILDYAIVKNIVAKNLEMIKTYKPLLSNNLLTLGMHFIRYTVDQNKASFSSPAWLHKDDEPLVFIHLVGLSRYALGGDNLIADQNRQITHVIRLENDMETLILNKAVYHAVTPLGSRAGVSARDVILFTIEPNHTQVVQNIEMVA